MNKETEHKKRSFRGWIIGAVLLLILLIGGRMLLKSDWLFEKVRGIVTEQVNDQLNGTLSIGEMKGDLLKGFTVRNINLQDPSSAEIASIDSVHIQYQFFSVLFSPYEIESFDLYGSSILIEQRADSSWNLQNLLTGSQKAEEESDPFYWSIENVTLSKADIEVRSKQYLPDEHLYLNEIGATLSVGILESGVTGTLRELDFIIRDGRLPEPVNVYLAGAAQSDRYTLNSIVINTGRSVLRGSGQFEEGGNIDQKLELSPLSWQDLAEYTADTPIKQNLKIELGAGGTLDNLQLSLNASGDALEQFQIEGRFNLRDTLALKQAQVSATGLDIPRLTGLENTPILQSFILNGEGAVLFGALDSSSWQGKLEVQSADYQKYSVDQLSTDYRYDRGDLNVDGTVNYENQTISLRGEIESFFEDQPEWDFHLNTERINPGLWLQDSFYNGAITLQIDAIGEGFDPNGFMSSADLIVSGGELCGQRFSNFSFHGTVNHNLVEGTLAGQITESRADVEFKIQEWQSNPAYEFELLMSRLNVAEFNGLEDFPTYLNGTITGSGTSFDPDEIKMMATANFDSSIVNAEQIEELNTELRIENKFLIVDEGALVSPIANASFTLDHHLFDLTNSANRLNFDATIKDLQPLAPLFSLTMLRSEGSINGNLGRNSGGMLQFNGELDLENVAVDTLFRAEQMSGSLVSYILEDPEFDLNVELFEPSIYENSVQDMQVYLHAKKYDFRSEGNMSLTINDGNNSSLQQSGTFYVDSTHSRLTTNHLTFQTQLRELMLENSFDINYSNEIFQVDSLTLSTDEGEAYMLFSAPRISSSNQEISLQAQNLNFGVLQKTILKESYFEGYLNGSLLIFNSPDSLSASIRSTVSDLKFNEGVMDSLTIQMDVKEEWLTASIESWHQSKQLADGSVRVPYLPGEPMTFDEEFFERPVEGSFDVNRSKLSYWFSFLPEGAPEQTNGTVALKSNLSGIAGSPDLEGRVSISDGLFSGIQVDLVEVDMTYLHESEYIAFNGSVTKDLRQILDFNSELPFKVDLKSAELNIPSGEDEIFVDLKTNNFDLALLNNYVNRDLVRGVKGRLEGAVTLSGAMNNLYAEGDMQLASGSMRVIPAGITLTEISSKLLFRRETVDLQQFTARSGPGRLRADGQIRMQSLEPDELEINIRANQFRVFNQPDYSAIINMNSSLNGTTSAPVVKGNITLLNGFYYLQDFGETSVETVELEQSGEVQISSEFYDEMDLEITVGVGRQFFIRNRQYLDMEVKLAGELDLVKEPDQELNMFGTLEGVDGYARPLGKEFKLEEALLTFYGPVDNPELKINTRYTPPQAAGVRIFYIIEGTVQEPEFRFESQPELELQDIISYTLFGRPFYELQSWEQVIAGSSNSPSAADLALEVVLDRVEMLASRKLGIDVVEIENSQSGSNNTVIKTGWYLNQSTFFAILNEIDGTSPKTLFTLEIMLRENLELILTQGDDTRQGVDLQWRKDY